MLKPLAIKWGTGVFLVHPESDSGQVGPQMIVEPKRGDGGGNPVSGRWQARFTSDYLAGEVDWRGPDGTVLSWRGPWSRYFYDPNAVFNIHVYYKGAILAAMPSPVYKVMGAAVADFDGRRYLLVITTDGQGDKLWARRLKDSGMEFQDVAWNTWWSENHTAIHPRPWFFSPTGKAASHVKKFYEVVDDSTAVYNYEHWTLQIDEGSAVLARDQITPITSTNVTIQTCDGQEPAGSGTWTVTETKTIHETANGSMLVAEDYDSAGNVVQLTAEISLSHQTNYTRTYTFRKEVLPPPPPGKARMETLSDQETSSSSASRTVTYYIGNTEINKETSESSASGSYDFDCQANSGTVSIARQDYGTSLGLVWADLRNGLVLFMATYDHFLENGSGPIVGGDNVVPGTGSYKMSEWLELCGSISVKSDEVVYVDDNWNGISVRFQGCPEPYGCSHQESHTINNKYFPFYVITIDGGAQATRSSVCLSVNFGGGFNYLTGGDLDELSGLTGSNRRYWPVFYLGESPEVTP